MARPVRIRSRATGSPTSLGKRWVPPKPGMMPIWTSGKPMRGKGQQTIPPGERLRLELPGGGGLGDPKEREREKVERDVRDGLVSPEAAEKVYGVKVT